MKLDALTYHLRIAVKNPAPICPEVNATVGPRIAGDDPLRTVLVAIIVDTTPGPACIVRAKDRLLVRS